MSEVAILGWNKNAWNIEADVYKIPQDILESKKLGSYNILIINDEVFKNSRQTLLNDILEFKKISKIIIVQSQPIPPLEILTLVHRYPIVALVKKEEILRVEDLILAILLSKRLEEQTEVYQKFLAEEETNQEHQYKKLLNELLEKQKKVVEIQNKILFTLQQEKLLHDTLLVLISSQSLTEIELRLQEILHPLIGKLHVRILIHSGTNHPQTINEANVLFELHEQEKSIGKLVFIALENQIFSKKELRLFENISDAISLHVPKLMAHEQNVALENEWRTTFDAISDPLIIVSENYSIIEANRAARERMDSSENISEPCYKLLFQRLSPCDFCRWGKKSNLEARSSKQGELWEMSSHELSHQEVIRNSSQNPMYVHLYRNKFHQRELEDKLKTFAQRAEVGIFKASLAHELNNPIGGLLTLAQLQKMDLPKENELFDVIREIEQQALVCRDLIQSLLQKSKEG